MSVDNLQLTHIPSVQQGMLVRRPPAEVFQAFVDPAITTKFWFTKSSGKMVAGTDIQWEWEMYGVSGKVSVIEVEDNSRILFEWRNGNQPTAVELRFIPWQDSTYVQVTETGLSGNGDEILAHAVDSIGGFSMVLCALKALLEHDVVLTTTLDHHPKGLEH